MAQFVHALWAAMTGEIVGTSDDHEGKRRRQPHRDHVGGDELTQSDAGVKPVGREIDQFLACRDLQFDLGIGLAEGCD